MVCAVQARVEGVYETGNTPTAEPNLSLCSKSLNQQDQPRSTGSLRRPHICCEVPESTQMQAQPPYYDPSEACKTPYVSLQQMPTTSSLAGTDTLSPVAGAYRISRGVGVQHVQVRLPHNVHQVGGQALRQSHDPQAPDLLRLGQHTQALSQGQAFALSA